MRRGPLFVALLAALAASACGGSGQSHEHEHGTAGSVTVSGGSGGFAGGELNPPQPTPDFTLTDQSGQKVSMADQRGKLVLLTFLYTNCPDVCPLITQNLNQALQMLGTKRDDVRVLAVSVDPEGDTPKAVDEYAKAHHLLPEFHYLIGSRDELTRSGRTTTSRRWRATPSSSTTPPTRCSSTGRARAASSTTQA